MAFETRSGPSKEKWRTLFVIAFFIAVPLALFWPALFLHGMLYGYDTLALGVPFHAEIRQSLAAHQWPLWMPDILGGMPGIASCNLQFLYPTDLLGCLSGLSIGDQDTWDAGIHVALAGIGMFLFLRRLDRSHSAAVLGAFFFAVSGSELSQIYGGYYNFVEGVALVPWAFWAAHKGREEGSLFAWGLCGAAFALQILAGATQLFVYTLIAVLCFVLSTARNSAGGATAPRARQGQFAATLPSLQGLGLALGLAFLLSAPQLWPTLQYLPLSTRQQGWTYAEFIGGSISPWEAMSWLVPGCFGWQTPTYHGAMDLSETCEYFGLLPWALAAAALSALWLREARVRFMAGLALVAFFLAQNRWVPFYQLFHHLPVLSGFRIWTRVLFLLTFAVCTSAAFGWDALRTAPLRKAALRGTFVFAALALSAATLAWSHARGRAVADTPKLLQYTGISVSLGQMEDLLAALARNSAWTTLMLLPLLMALLWSCTKRLGAGAALVLALGFHMFDQSQMTTRFVTFMDPAEAVGHPRFTAPPPTPAGTVPWRIFDTDFSFPNNNIVLGYENLEGRESMPMTTTMDMRAAMSGRRADWTNMMNERYFFFHTERGSSIPGDKVTIYENHRAFPRAWLVGQSLKVADDGQADRLLADPTFNPRLEVALPVDAGLGPMVAGPPLHGAVLWLSRGPQTESLDVSTGRDAVLVLSNAWHPSWRCEVDGQDTPVLKADGGLQAVILRAGRHQVDFRFDNGLFYDALAACLAGLVALMGLFLYDVPVQAPNTGGHHAPWC